MNTQFGVCNLSLVPLRTEPSDKSEMCSQLLFGDHFTLIEITEKNGASKKSQEKCANLPNPNRGLKSH